MTLLSRKSIGKTTPPGQIRGAKGRLLVLKPFAKVCARSRENHVSIDTLNGEMRGMTKHIRGFGFKK